MVDSRENLQQPEHTETRVSLLDVKAGDLGFHYTIDRGLPGTLQYGLLSRMEERKRGLNLRVRASRSVPIDIYFTTRINDLYFFGDENATLDERLSDAVGIAIDRPDYARTREGHFAEENVVEPDKFRALVFVDRRTFEKSGREKWDTYDNFRFGEALPQEVLATRVASLRKICEENGLDLPIYGVSGDMYWPERKSWRDIARKE